MMDDKNMDVESDVEETIKKKFKSNLYKPPTVEELNDLKETENLFHSNIFRMQITELLNEVILKDMEIDKYQNLSNALIKALKSMKSCKERQIKDLEFFKKQKIHVPLSEICEKLDGSYSFQTPSKVALIGSFLLKNLIKPIICIDIGVEMPCSYFNERDFMNYRYFAKRALYLCHTYAKLTKTNASNDFTFKYEAEHGSMFKPYLSLISKNSTDNFQIRLHFSCEASTFKLHRFNPTRSNVRKNWCLENSDLNKESENNLSTPHYNFEAICDLRLFDNNEYLSKTITSKGLIEGTCLLKLWLQQRQLNTGYGSFNSFIISMFVAYLVSIKKINHLMSSYQVFRITLLNLSQSTWNEMGISMKQTIENATDEHLLNVAEFNKHYQVVFLDSSGYINLCSNMSESTFLRIKYEAKQAINFLNNQLIDSFDVLFMKKMNFFNSFDSILSVKQDEKENVFENIVKIMKCENNLIDFNSIHLSVAIIEKYIKLALENRIVLCFTKLIENFQWEIEAIPPSHKTSILAGLLFDKDYTNVLLKGPVSNLPEAVEFRKFWGDKSELRRFQDGTICEAVYFECSDISSKREIYTKIIKHIFKLHLKIDEKNINILHSQLDTLISLPKEIVENYGTGEEKQTNVVHVLEELIKILKGLKGMPLSFVNIQAISPVARLTDVFSPLPCCFKYDKKSEKNLRYKIGQKYLPVYPLSKVITPYVECIRVCCLLETSTKWPDNIDCIRRLKCAFNLKMVQLLRDNYGLTAFTNVDFSDVLYKGYVFRLFIGTTRELMIMKTKVDDSGIITTRSTEDSIKLEKNMFHLTKLTSVLHGLQQEYSLYSGVTRLAKRWLSSQLLLDYYSEEAIDLICAYLFVHPEPYSAPKSLVTGFIRFLELMANFDWKSQALIININNEFKKDDVIDIQMNFQKNRSQLPVIYIATPYDEPKGNSIWTKEKPSIQILFRTVLLSKECLKMVQNLDLTNSINLKSLFRPSVSIYDAIIHLKPEYCPRAYQKVDLIPGVFLSKYRNYDPNNEEKTLPVVEFEPVKLYVKQLRDAYSEFAVFFYDIYGGTDVYVLWKPKAFEGRDFKVSSVNGRTLDINKNRLVTNIEAIIDDIRIIGNELVKDITVRIERWKFE